MDKAYEDEIIMLQKLFVLLQKITYIASHFSTIFTSINWINIKIIN